MDEFKGFSEQEAMSSGKGVPATGEEPSAMVHEVWTIPTAALITMLLLAWVTRSLVERISGGGAILECDTMVLEWFRAHSTPELDAAVHAFTFLGSPFAMTIYAFAGLSLLVKRRQWLLLYTWDVLFVGILLLTQGLKFIFHRSRPLGAEQFLSSMSWSFPSTHALSASAGFGMIAFVLARLAYRDREQRALLIIVTILLVIGIGTSRLYLGVHYLSDVLVGLTVGGIWLAVCLFAYHRSGLRALSGSH